MPPLPVTLDYAPPPARLLGRIPWRSLAGAAGLLLLFASPAIPVSTLVVQVDPVTGTMSRQTVWPLGLTTGPRLEVSPLHKRLTAGGIPWTQTWCTLHTVDRNLYGGVTSRGCATAPPVLSLRPMLGTFVATSTDAELSAFVRVMESGADAAQQAAVEAVTGKLLPPDYIACPARE